MAAPKGNKNAAKLGTDKKYRVRLLNDEDHGIAALMTPYQRGLALLGYHTWLASVESDDMPFLDWMTKATGQDQDYWSEIHKKDWGND